jgi:hypothetical protein
MPNGNQLYGGTLPDFETTDNMAREIENAFTAMRISAGITQPLPTGASANDMRIMFLAIARGVIQHLKNNPKAFAVEVTGGSLTSDGSVTSVNTIP